MHPPPPPPHSCAFYLDILILLARFSCSAFFFLFCIAQMLSAHLHEPSPLSIEFISRWQLAHIVGCLGV